MYRDGIIKCAIYTVVGYASLKTIELGVKAIKTYKRTRDNKIEL